MDVKLKNSNVIIHAGKRLNLTAGDPKSFLSLPKFRVDLSSRTKSGSSFFSLRSPKKIKREEVYIFANQLAVLLDSGVPMLSGLDILAQQTENTEFRKTIEGIKEDINAGVTLTRALSKFSKIFPHLFVSMVRAAEVGGHLPEILKLVAQYLQEQDKLDKKLKSAIVYPKFVFIFFVILLIGIIFGLVPKFEETFATFNAKLPQATQILLDTSRWALDHIVIEVIGGVAFFISYRHFRETETGKLVLEKLKLKVPVLGNLILKSALSKFSRTLKILMQSGVPLVESLTIAGDTAEHILFTNALRDIKQGVVEGNTLSREMSRFALFPPMVVKMVATGEESGSLENMLKNISELYDTQVDSQVAGLTSIIEPVLMIGLGAIAIIVILALYMPIFKIGDLNY